MWSHQIMENRKQIKLTILLLSEVSDVQQSLDRIGPGKTLILLSLVYLIRSL